jgi:hypothetical protein
MAKLSVSFTVTLCLWSVQTLMTLPSLTQINFSDLGLPRLYLRDASLAFLGIFLSRLGPQQAVCVEYWNLGRSRYDTRGCVAMRVDDCMERYMLQKQEHCLMSHLTKNICYWYPNPRRSFLHSPPCVVPPPHLKGRKSASGRAFISRCEDRVPLGANVVSHLHAAPD